MKEKSVWWYESYQGWYKTYQLLTGVTRQKGVRRGEIVSRGAMDRGGS